MPRGRSERSNSSFVLAVEDIVLMRCYLLHRGVEVEAKDLALALGLALEGLACLEEDLALVGLKGLDLWAAEANLNLVLEGLVGVEDCAIASQWMWK